MGAIPDGISTRGRPSYTKPFCDLCRKRFDYGERLVYLQFTLSKSLSDGSGFEEHEGHLCPACNDLDESLELPGSDSIRLVRFHYALDEDRALTILSFEVKSVHDGHWQRPPGELPEKVKAITQTCLGKMPSVEFEQGDAA